MQLILTQLGAQGQSLNSPHHGSQRKHHVLVLTCSRAGRQLWPVQRATLASDGQQHSKHHLKQQKYYTQTDIVYTDN